MEDFHVVPHRVAPLAIHLPGIMYAGSPGLVLGRVEAQATQGGTRA